MNQTYIYVLFYALSGIGAFAVLVLLIKILRKEEEIDKNTVTWLIVAFVCIVFPIIGNMTIEYGDLKITITNLRSNSEKVDAQLSELQAENQHLKASLAELGEAVESSRSVLLNEDVPQYQKVDQLNQVQRKVEDIGNQSVGFERQLESANQSNRMVLDEIDRRFEKGKR